MQDFLRVAIVSLLPGFLRARNQTPRSRNFENEQGYSNHVDCCGAALCARADLSRARDDELTYKPFGCSLRLRPGSDCVAFV